jgi:hypothetical protein
LLLVEPLPIPFVGFDGRDQLGIDATSHVFRRDSIPSPDGSVEEGSAIAIDECHCTTLRAVPRFGRTSSVARRVVDLKQPDVRVAVAVAALKVQPPYPRILRTTAIEGLFFAGITMISSVASHLFGPPQKGCRRIFLEQLPLERFT